MDEFSYLSVLIGLILGLGITKLMEGVGHLVQVRGRIVWYWPLKLWAVVLLVFHLQAWWAMYELRHITDWTFAGFLIVLIQPILLFLLSALALPDVGEIEKTDLRTSFTEHASFTFRIAMLMVFSSLLKEYWLYHRLPQVTNLAFHCLFIAVFSIGSFSGGSRRYEWVVLSTGLILLLYISLLFIKLL